MPFIFIVGLPGSGKTTLSKKLLLDYPDAILLDDSLGFINVGKLKSMGENNMVIISDPRLTSFELFKFITSKLPNVLKVYIFENNPSKCIVNINTRCRNDNTPDKIPLLTIDINNLSHSYDINCYYNDSWETLILSVP